MVLKEGVLLWEVPLFTIVIVFPISAPLCKSGQVLVCAAGDLGAKHGPLEVASDGGIRAVLTDPFLPLSGPLSGTGPSTAKIFGSIRTSRWLNEPSACNSVNRKFY